MTSTAHRLLMVRDLGRMRFADALQEQEHLVELRKHGEGADTLLLMEHPPVITMGRNGDAANILASPEVLARAGFDYHETNRGGDVTYHGPGQIVGYPILDLREWRRDVHAYFHGVEQMLIDALGQVGVRAGRIEQRGYEGVWVNGAKIAAIGVHISRWITSHGFALNFDTDLTHFQYIVPCGLSRPVCSLRSLGVKVSRERMTEAIVASFAETFGYGMAARQQEIR